MLQPITSELKLLSLSPTCLEDHGVFWEDTPSVCVKEFDHAGVGIFAHTYTMWGEFFAYMMWGELSGKDRYQQRNPFVT